MAKELVHRVRAFAPKTKTGCRTCRQRRVKCDEHKPSCKKCSLSRRTCEWFEAEEQSQTSSSSHSPIGSDDSTCDAGRVAISATSHGQHGICDTAYRDVQPHSLAIGLNKDERSAVGFFICRTARDLGYSFPSVQWIPLSLQIGHREPALRHAIAALGSMHQARKSFTHTSLVPVLDPAHYKHALDAYSKALVHLRRRMLDTTPDDKSLRTMIVLLSCLLFFCLEHLQGESATACLHMQQGHSIIKELQADGDPQRQIEEYLGHTTKLFAGFENVDLSVQQRLKPSAPLGSASAAIYVPNRFADFAQANDCLKALEHSRLGTKRELLRMAEEALNSSQNSAKDFAVSLCIRYYLSRTIDISSRLELQQQLDALETAYGAWYAAFSNPLSNLGTDYHAAAIIHIEFLASRFALAMSRTPDERICDRFENDFCKILDLAEKCLLVFPSTKIEPVGHEVGSLSRLGFALALSTDLLAHVALCGFKSRYTSTRRRAMELLINANKLEGIYQSAVLAGFISRPMACEEDRARRLGAVQVGTGFVGPDIPEEARFADVVFAQVEYRPRCINMVAVRQAVDECGEPAVEVFEDIFDIFDGKNITQKQYNESLRGLYQAGIILPPSSQVLSAYRRDVATDGHSATVHPLRSLSPAMFLSKQGSPSSICSDANTVRNIVIKSGDRHPGKDYASSQYLNIASGIGHHEDKCIAAGGKRLQYA